MNNLIDELEEQIVMAFTGKVNVLNSENSQHIGVIFIKDGMLVNCLYRGESGPKSLIELILKSNEAKDQYSYVSEPEIINDSDVKFKTTIDELLGNLSYQKNIEEGKKKLRPPANMKLLIDGSFVLEGDPVTPIEFDVLKVISDYNKVEDIYNNSQMLSSEVTNALVTLRKKKALKVIGK